MGNICKKLSFLVKSSNKANHLNTNTNTNNTNNNTNNTNTNNTNTNTTNTTNTNKKNKYIPSLIISNNSISFEDEEPPSYREVRDERANFYKKTMLFNGFSDSLIKQ